MKTLLLLILILGCLVYFFSRFAVFISEFTLNALAEKPDETIEKILTSRQFAYLKSYDRFTALTPQIILNLKFINIFYSYLETKVAFDIFSKKKVANVRNDLLVHLMKSNSSYLDIPLYQLAKDCSKFYEENYK